MTALSFEITYDGDADHYKIVWQHHGLYEASGVVVRGAIKAGKRDLYNRWADIHDGESDKAQELRELRALPMLAQAIVVGEFSPWYDPDWTPWSEQKQS